MLLGAPGRQPPTQQQRQSCYRQPLPPRERAEARHWCDAAERVGWKDPAV